MKRLLLGFAGFVTVLAGTATASFAEPAAAADIGDRLRAVPGLTVVAERTGPPGYRLFSLTYRQPVDHRLPARGTFNQRLTVLYKADNVPMVLHTSGYGVFFDRPFRSEPTFLLGSNQISVEQRFFTPSRPVPADWSALTIWQAATDHHRIVAALKPIFPVKWISTGGSKGGMASVYHRRFYPSDVDATVAYVAPNDVEATEDSAYTRFFQAVGTDPACRAGWANLQREALRRRSEIVARFTTWAQANNQTFTRTIGSADRAFEMLVLDAPWLFWQYKSQIYCRNMPPPTASTDTIYNFLNFVAGFASYTDQGIDFYIPYYVQAGVQLGYPSFATPHLTGLLRYPGLYAPRSFVPRSIPLPFEPTAMADVDTWVRQQGGQLLFVYGQYDPWGAEPFRLGPGSRDSLWLQVPGGNHNVDIADLPAADRAVATAALRRWAGVTTPTPAGVSRLSGVDDWDADRGHRRL